MANKVIYPIISLFLILSIPSSVEAKKVNDVKQNPEAKAKKQTELLKSELSLTEKQEKEVYTICLQHILANQADIEKKNSSTNSNKRNEAIKNILTEEQKEKYNYLEIKRKEKEKKEKR